MEVVTQPFKNCVLQSGRGRDPRLLAVARDTWELSVRFDFRVLVRHVAGVDNQLADAMSRYTQKEEARRMVSTFMQEGGSLRTVSPEWQAHVARMVIV